MLGNLSLPRTQIIPKKRIRNMCQAQNTQAAQHPQGGSWLFSPAGSPPLPQYPLELLHQKAGSPPYPPWLLLWPGAS
jgi:hypothetical protein